MRSLVMFLSVLALLGLNEHPLRAEGRGGAAPEKLRQEILTAREAVWRSWFANDQERLRALLPDDTIAINNGEEAWQSRDEILAAAGKFAAAGGRLVRMEFPRVEVQVFGDVAVVYSQYLFEVETAGARQVSSGRATEVFVRRAGRWVNPGWHMDSGR
jgi:ketosteroid isomerase-like protein